MNNTFKTNYLQKYLMNKNMSRNIEKIRLNNKK